MKIIVVGGGITGLSAAWNVQKLYPEAEIVLYEKESRLGGWIQTNIDGGFLFEKGPRTFQAKRSFHLCQLLEELEIPTIGSDPSASKRYILHNGKLRNATSFFPGLIPYLIRECFIKPTEKEDESIYEFASRRFSPKVAETLFDPLTLGIYAGDIRKLSVRACFPALHQMEKEHGSIVKAMLKSEKKKSSRKGLFTISTGMQTLIDVLEKKLKSKFVLKTYIEKIEKDHVVIQGKKVHGDFVINALPPDIPKNSIWVVNLAYNQEVLSKKGYGYLVPSKEEESVLGVIFDSLIFPQQNQPHQTRLTAMVKGASLKPLEVTLDALNRHLNIESNPDYFSVFLAKEAISQFPVGYPEIAKISVDACVERGKTLASSLSQ